MEVILMNLVLMQQSQFKCKKRAYEKQVKRLKEKYSGVNSRLQYIRHSNRKLNCLRWHNNETRAHIIKKLDLCRWLKEINHTFITEAIFNNNSRADLVDLSSGVIYEILFSEKDEDCDKKVKKYPENLKLLK